MQCVSSVHRGVLSLVGAACGLAWPNNGELSVPSKAVHSLTRSANQLQPQPQCVLRGSQALLAPRLQHLLRLLDPQLRVVHRPARIVVV